MVVHDEYAYALGRGWKMDVAQEGTPGSEAVQEVSILPMIRKI
jgi:hypothetical protein